ncbi:113_t:CDS:1, partial [Racocetra persica]
RLILSEMSKIVRKRTESASWPQFAKVASIWWTAYYEHPSFSN